MRPSGEVRVTRLVACSQVRKRPWRSKVLPLALFEGLRKVVIPCRGIPAAHVVARHVAEDEPVLPGVPDRPLGEEKAGGDLLDRGVLGDDRLEARGSRTSCVIAWRLAAPSPSWSPTCQSAAATSSNTTQTWSLARPVTSLTAVAMRRPISAFLASGASAITSRTSLMLTNGMSLPPSLDLRGHRIAPIAPVGQGPRRLSVAEQAALAVGEGAAPAILATIEPARARRQSARA